jgi:hypothetical protein
MRKLLFAFFLFPVAVFSQGIDNLWMMGYASFGGPPNGGINIDLLPELLSLVTLIVQ